MDDAMLSSKEVDFLRSERVARMATINQANKSPHAVPVCFAFDGEDIYTTLGVSSKRLKNIEGGSKTSVLIDKYEEENEEWKVLCGLLIYGNAEILTYDENREEFMHGWRLLIEKARARISSRRRSDSEGEANGEVERRQGYVHDNHRQQPPNWSSKKRRICSPHERKPR
jgi:nitroimidazol reductase NimA-like FMN-containing flavoprotein (pyridoxamine 5'-phosphate oxidase superfamily)